MFVKQIEMKEALRLAADGQEVMLLAPSTPTPENWMEYYPDTLQGFLEGCMYFRRELAMTNPEFEAVVQNMVSEDAAKTAAEPTEPQQDRSEESAEPSEGGQEKPSGNVGAGAKRKKVDIGKLKALRKAGWSMKKIVVEFGVSEATIFNYLKKLEEKDDGKTDASEE